MRIDTEKMAALGYKVRLDRKDGAIIIFSSDVADDEINKTIMDCAGRLGFNEAETEQLLATTYKIQILSVIRRCSGW